MKLTLLLPCISIVGFTLLSGGPVTMKINKAYTIDSLGACQGVSYQKGKVFLYGDREVGVIREYNLANDSLIDQHHEMRLTVNGQDVINHPTGFAVHDKYPVFVGNSIRLNPEGTLWKAVIYQINWPRLQKTGTLDGNLISTIEDDACIQGTRPEYVNYHNKWYVATADYGNKGNEVRLYDPAKLAHCKKTSEPGVLYKKFTCTPWVQNLYWMAGNNTLVLVQNQVEGRRWRFTYVNLEQSIDSGKMVVTKQLDMDRQDELEGFAFTNHEDRGIAVTSSRSSNINFIDVTW